MPTNDNNVEGEWGSVSPAERLAYVRCVWHGITAPDADARADARSPCQLQHWMAENAGRATCERWQVTAPHRRPGEEDAGSPS